MKISKKNMLQMLYVIAAFSFMIIVSFISIRSVAEKNLSSGASKDLNEAEDSILLSLKEPQVTLDSTAFTLCHMMDNGYDNASIESYMMKITDSINLDESRVSGFNGIYGYIRGEYLDGAGWVPEADYVPTERPWYTAATEANGAIGITTPYIDAHTGTYILSLGKQIISDDGQDYGVLIIDVEIDRITEYVRNLKFSENGYGFLFDSEMNILSHGYSELINTSALSGSESYQDIANKLQQGREISEYTIKDIDGNSAVVFARKIDVGNWYLGIVTPEAEYYESVYGTLLILLALGITMMVILCSMLSRLEKSRLRSEEESRSKSSFLANMSHEMRTPMNAIIGMSEIALKDESISPSVKKQVSIIHNSGKNLLWTINDILDISKIESGKLTVDEAPYLK